MERVFGTLKRSYGFRRATYVALALGARYVSLARPFLVAADESPEAVIALGERLIRELRTAMFLVGARTPKELRRGLLIQA